MILLRGLFFLNKLAPLFKLWHKETMSFDKSLIFMLRLLFLYSVLAWEDALAIIFTNGVVIS